MIGLTTSASKIIDAVTTGIYTTPYVNNGPLTSVTFTRTGDVVGNLATFVMDFTLSTSLTAS